MSDFTPAAAAITCAQIGDIHIHLPDSSAIDISNQHCPHCGLGRCAECVEAGLDEE